MKMRLMKKGKKASLNMSISTIVVLILAMTMLGFGLMFIKGIFSKAGSQFNQVSGDVEKLLKEKLKDNNARLILQQEDFTIKKGSKATTYFALRNDLDDKYTFTIMGNGVFNDDGSLSTDGSIVACYTNDDGISASEAKTHITFQLPKKISLKQGDVKVFPMSIKVSSSASTDTTYYCKFLVWDPKDGSKEYASVDFTVYVKS